MSDCREPGGSPADPVHPLLALVPHAPPLLLVDTLQLISEEACRTRTRVDPAAWYAQADGSMPAWFGLELMAQTAAVFNGHRASQLGLPPAMGYLLGTRDYTCSQPAFPAGAILEVEARLLYAATFNQSAMLCQIHLGDTPVATATLKFYEQP